MNRIVITTILILALFSGCTDIEETVYDKYAAEEFYASEEGSDAALASVYEQIPGNWEGVGYAGADRGWYDINSSSTDEQVIPHRTTGDWELTYARLHKREWLPTHQYFNTTWNWLYESVFQANLAIEQLETAGADPSKIAEARVLRAFFYYMLMDAFGNVPFYTENNMAVDQIPQKDRAEIYEFVVGELKEYVDDLPAKKAGDFYGRFNKWAGYTLLAKVYLNAEVYTGEAKWQECLEACRKVEEGGYSLHSGALDESHPLGSKYFELFGNKCPNDETILAIYTTVDVVGRNIFTIRSLGGTDGTLLAGANGWNGTIVPKDFVERFSDDDIRKRQFRYGSDPYGPQPEGFIEYSLEVNSLDNPGAAPNAGARNQKFWPAEPVTSGGASNDFPIYRYADILLMKAECHLRMGNAGGAKPFIDQVRERAGLEPLDSAPTLEHIYWERGRELAFEGHRRQDMIRFGKFTEAHGFASAVDDHYRLFPIPTAALNENPNLTQNPGY